MFGKIALLGAAAALALVVGAQAQPYGNRYDGDRYDNARVTYDRDGTETIIVRPDRDYIEKHTMIGRSADGEINPTAYSMSRSVDLADLDLSQPADRQEMRNRVYRALARATRARERAVSAYAAM